MADKVKLESLNIKEDKIKKLKEVFPEIVSENKVDFEKLRLTLGDEVDTGKERYGMNWPGKANCFKIIQTPSKATLKPSKEESIDFDTTENLFIEGDSLEVLKLLQSSYYGKVKMIYIDPPYNTGKDFVYPDNYSESLETYLRYTGQKGKDGLKLSTNTESEGRYHSKWMNMMYVRLFLAKNLLKEDGVIFISIDDHEVDNLNKICNEIFGEENFIALIPVVMNLKGNQDAFGFAETHEYFIVYAKQREFCKIGQFNIDDEELIDGWTSDQYGLYKEADNLRATGVNAPRSKRPNLWYPIFINENDSTFYISADNQPKQQSDVVLWPINPEGIELSWYWSKNTFNDNIHNLILKKTQNGYQFYRKQRPQLGDLPTKKPKSFFYKPEYSSSTATTRLKELMGTKIFDNPKPVPFIFDLLQIGSQKEDVVLDFFAGSATTAQAVFDLNNEDNGNRKFIMVQIPEPTDENSDAYKAGYENIAEIGKERIRKVINKIKEHNNGKLGLDDTKQNLGFRVFKLDESNFKVWEGEKPEDLAKQLELYKNNVRDDSKPDDILYELILKSGFEISCKVEELKIQGKKVYSIEDGQLMICLEKGLTKELMKEIAEKEPARVICLDEGFEGNDQLLTNTVEILKTKGVEFRTV